MNIPKSTYLYEGPIYRFEDIIIQRWKGTTQAISPGKAKTNFLFRIKKNLNLSIESKISIDETKIKKLN